jgi:hypothetical protein
MERENQSSGIDMNFPQSSTPDNQVYDTSSIQPPVLTSTKRNSKKDPKDITEMDLIAEKLEKKNNEHNSEKNKNFEITEENYLLKNIPNKGIYIFRYVYIYIYVYVHIYVYIYIFICICRYTCM